MNETVYKSALPGIPRTEARAFRAEISILVYPKPNR